MTAPDHSIAWDVRTYSHLPSTQDAVRELAVHGAPEGAVVQAMMQTAGRGRQGNSWASPLGNLYMSVLLRPGCPAGVVGQLAFVLAVALSSAIDEIIAPDLVKTLKWPNDVLIDGKKCAGILLESALGPDGRVESLIAGVGVNIHAPPEGRVGLQQVAPGQVAVHPFRDILLAQIATHYNQWRSQGFAPVRAQWMAQAHGIGLPMTARLAQNSVPGIFRGLEDNGALRLETADGKVMAIPSGEVYFSEPRDLPGPLP